MKQATYALLLSVSLIGCTQAQADRSSELEGTKWAQVLDDQSHGNYIEFGVLNKYEYHIYEIGESYSGIYFLIGDTLNLISLGKKHQLKEELPYEKRRLPSFSKCVISDEKLLFKSTQKVENGDWTEPKASTNANYYLTRVR